METDSRPVRLESSNGHIDLTMDAAREVHADTSNSSITVRIPNNVGATVRAHTSNAPITTDFDVNVHSGMISKHRLEGNIGSGGPLLDLGRRTGRLRFCGCEGQLNEEALDSPVVKNQYFPPSSLMRA